jgi:hypothetical protein
MPKIKKLKRHELLVRCILLDWLDHPGVGASTALQEAFLGAWSTLERLGIVTGEHPSAGALPIRAVPRWLRIFGDVLTSRRSLHGLDQDILAEFTRRLMSRSTPLGVPLRCLGIELYPPAVIIGGRRTPLRIQLSSCGSQIFEVTPSYLCPAIPPMASDSTIEYAVSSGMPHCARVVRL